MYMQRYKQEVPLESQRAQGSRVETGMPKIRKSFLGSNWGEEEKKTKDSSPESDAIPGKLPGRSCRCTRYLVS